MTLLEDLWTKSLDAECAKHPHLLTITPKLVNADPPEILFRSRLKGYYLCNHLCRIWVLECLRAARGRGEFFVKWVNPTNGENHDGTRHFAHFFTIFYLKLHKPGMSVAFDSNGALRSTSVHVTKIRNYVWAHRHALARRCHDMSKQMYCNKKYTPDVWKPLHEFLYKHSTCTQLRISRLMAFTKADDDLHVVVAKCLWRLANAPNLPWGRAAVQPNTYSVIPIAEKVHNVRICIRLITVIVFFF